MRPIVALACACGLALAAGCTNTRWGFLKTERDRPVQGAPPTKEEVVAYLNDNAGRIKSVSCESLAITVHQGLVPIGLSGQMRVETPHNFRMSGDFAAQRMVDLGSNNQEFWWWISKDNPPNQYFCSYSDLKDGRVRSLPFPFQPEWIMETMGLGPYGPADKYELEHDDYTLKLVERTRSVQGRQVRKVIVMKRAPQKLPNPQVVAYLLLDDATGTELCSAHIAEAQVLSDGKSQSILPRRLELRWPEAKARLDMRFDNLSVNSAIPPEAFVRREMTGVRSVDLAQMFGNTSVQPVQGILNP